MSITDPEEMAYISQIVHEQQIAMYVAARLQQDVQRYSLTDIPTSITIPGTSPGQVQYMVIVEVRNPATGETQDIPLTIYDDNILGNDQITQRVQGIVEYQQYDEKYKARISGYQQPEIAEIRLISVSRRV